MATSKNPIHLIIDSTGLSMVGDGEWAAAKHGGRGKRGWRKLHLGVDRAGTILTQVLTDSSGDDARTGLKVIKETKGRLSSVTGDAAYDTLAIYDQAASRGARVVVPPTRTASVSGGKPRSTERDRTIRRVDKVGRRRWKKESGYHRQGTVESAFFGLSVAISGNAAVVGAFWDDDNGLDSGSAYLFDASSVGVNYCSPAITNSSGVPSRISAIGSDTAGINNVSLVAE